MKTETLFDDDEVTVTATMSRRLLDVVADVVRIGEEIGFPSDLKVDPETGEVLEDLSAPDPLTSSALVIADYLGPRLTGSQARLDALIAERKAWEKRIGEMFDARIKREQSYQAWLKSGFRNTLLAYYEANIKPSGPRTLTLGMIKLAKRRTQERVIALDTEAAIAWAKEACPAAVKTTETFLISKADEGAIRAGIVSGVLGSVFAEVPASDTFEVK